MTGVRTARRALRRRALASVLGLALLLYFAAWFAVVLTGLFGGPVDYRMVGGVLLASGAAVVVVGVPALGLWVVTSRVSPASVRPGWRLLVVLAVSVVLLVGVVAWRGVVSPFAPVATRVDAACASLDAAGLADHWPAGTRQLNQDDGDGRSSICGWTMRADARPPAPYVGVTARVTLFDGSGSSSGLAAAVRYFRGEVDDVADARIDGIGDEAFATGSVTSAEVVARRANVVVSVEFSLRGDSEGPDATVATAAARDMVGRIVAGVEVR